MTFDNSRTIISLRIKMFFATITLLAYLAVVYIISDGYTFLGLSDTVWTVILVAVYLIIVFLPVVRSYQYIYFSDEGDNLVFRYFFTGMVGGKKNSISISKRLFAGYKVETKYSGLIRSVILSQKVGKNIAKYPPVYISALNRDQREKLFSWLNQYVPKT